mgnify:FL=1
MKHFLTNLQSSLGVRNGFFAFEKRFQIEFRYFVFENLNNGFCFSYLEFCIQHMTLIQPTICKQYSI